MPSSSAHSQDRRDRRRTSHLPKLDIPDEGEEAQSPSPRSELLSSITTNGHLSFPDQGHSSGHRTRRRHDGRSSHKHSSGHSSHRKRDKSSASHRELVDTIAHGDDLDRQLHKTLEATVRRLEEEARKARDLERVTKETAQKFIEVNESRLNAQKEASEASRALREEQLRLEEAQKEIERARAMVKDLARQKEEAEQSAARARAKARKLQQRQLVMQAREEGRKMGFEAGIKQAQEEYESVVPYEPSARSQTRPRHHRRRSHTPPRETDTDGDEGYYEEGETMRTDDIRSPRPQPHSQPVVEPLHPSPQPPPPRPPSPPPPPPPAREQFPEFPIPQPERTISPASTFPVEKFEVNIPTADEIVNSSKLPREQWVTAQKHKEITGADTTPHPTPRKSLQHQTPNAPSRPEPNFAIHPDLARQVQESGQPMMIYPTQGQHPGLGQFPQPMHQGSAPPNSGTAKKPRFPTLAKTKSKAASWYRSFSLRKKNRPIIDPDDDEEAEPQSANSVEPQSAESRDVPRSTMYANPADYTHPNGIIRKMDDEEGDDDEDRRMYEYQPKPRQKWYVPSQEKSTKTRHVRKASPQDRHSVASTRLSDMGMVSSVPTGYRGDGASMSGKSATTRNLAQKLSSIQEDPLTRANAGGGYVGGIAGYGAPIPAPNFAAPGSEVGSTRTGRRRPPGITVQNPNGLANPAVQMGQAATGHLAPPLVHASSALIRSTSTSGEIHIDVQPATAAPIRSAGIPRNMTQAYLTPNYQPVYAQSTASRRSRQSAQVGGHRMTQSYSEPPQPQPHQRPQSDARSGRSGHSRSQSAQAEAGPYPPELVSKSTQSILKSRDYAPGSAMYGMDSAGSTSQFLDTSTGNAVRRSPSRSSMHSKYDPDTYLDPAYFGAESAKGKGKGKGKAVVRERSRSSGLEYVDP